MYVQVGAALPGGRQHETARPEVPTSIPIALQGHAEAAAAQPLPAPSRWPAKPSAANGATPGRQTTTRLGHGGKRGSSNLRLPPPPLLLPPPPPKVPPRPPVDHTTNRHRRANEEAAPTAPATVVEGASHNTGETVADHRQRGAAPGEVPAEISTDLQATQSHVRTHTPGAV